MNGDFQMACMEAMMAYFKVRVYYLGIFQEWLRKPIKILATKYTL
jgi:hypothetical protein